MTLWPLTIHSFWQQWHPVAMAKSDMSMPKTKTEVVVAEAMARKVVAKMEVLKVVVVQEAEDAKAVVANIPAASVLIALHHANTAISKVTLNLCVAASTFLLLRQEKKPRRPSSLNLVLALLRQLDKRTR